MKSDLNARRQKLLRELDRINRQILETKKSIAQIESKIDTFRHQSQANAA